jgi:transposase
VTELPDLTGLSHDEKDALIRALWAQVQMLTSQVLTLAARVAELEAKLGEPPKTPDNSSVPPSQGKKPNRADKPQRDGPRKSLPLRRRGAAWGARAAAECWRRTPTRR